PLLDLRPLPPAGQEAAAAELVRTLVARPVDLARGPLLATALVRTRERSYRLVLTLHHIVSDGWSMGVFLRELAALYGALTSGRPSLRPAGSAGHGGSAGRPAGSAGNGGSAGLAELPLQYAD